MSVTTTPESIKVRLFADELSQLVDALTDQLGDFSLSYSCLGPVRDHGCSAALADLEGQGTELCIAYGDGVTVTPEEFAARQVSVAVGRAKYAAEACRIRRGLVELEACRVSLENVAELLGKNEAEVRLDKADVAAQATVRELVGLTRAPLNPMPEGASQ